SVLVDPGEGVGDALAIGRADVGSAAREVLQMADGDLRLRGAGGAADQQRERDRAQKGSNRHFCFLLLIR
ncbi:hypothetical protein chiPu_0033303, partial [Chiloscyllium punctatum]|nr:hypothetical protein [Chiloscyllium punctatum]